MTAKIKKVFYTKKKYYLLIIAMLIWTACFRLTANQIVYPWRACPAIVPVGKTLEIWYDNLTVTSIDSVILQGPYNRVILPVEAVQTGKFEYDSYTKFAVNNLIKVTIPEGAPEELYDLIVKSGNKTDISKKSVKVLKTYRNPHRFIHITDPHTSRQWVGTPENGYAKELELLDRFIEVANIICPEYIIVTGDIIHDYTRFNADALGWGGVERSGNEYPPLAEEKYENYFEGAKGFSGVYGFNAPVFSLPGNHDFYGVKSDDYMAKASQWNRLMGKRVYGFSYLDTRIIASDDFLGDPVIDIPSKAPMSGLQGLVLDGFLNAAGPGKFRIMAQHSHNRFDLAFLNRNRINLLLNGHGHQPFQEFIGSTPTLSIRPGVVCRSGEIANWTTTLGFFRIFTIDGGTFQYSPPLRFCENPTLPYHQLVLNLTLSFKHDNSGQSKSNEATLTNRFDIDLTGCRVRFVMPGNVRGYHVTGGEVCQIIENNRFTIVDVRTDVKAKSSTSVSIDESQTIIITNQPETYTAVTQGSITGSLSVEASVAGNASLTYQWYSGTTNSNTGGTIVDGATGASFAIPKSLSAGKYYYFCEVRAAGATSVRSGVAAVTVLQQQATVVETSDAPLARAYPNPTDGTVILQFEATGKYVVTISDMAGKVLLIQTVNDQTAQLDLSNYPAAVYMLTIDDGKRKDTMRIIRNYCIS